MKCRSESCRYLPAIGLVAVFAWSTGCGTESTQRFELTSLDVSRVPVSLSTPALLSGKGFFAAAAVDLNGSGAQLDASFTIFVGDAELGADAVARIDSETLALVFPLGLPVGLHDLRVVSPSGQQDVLTDALLVAEPVLHIEDAGDGSGSLVQSAQLAVGSSLELFAISRWPDGLLFRPENADWSRSRNGGTLHFTSTSLLVSATGPDTISVLAQSELFGSATAEIQTAACFVDGDCADTCRSTNACVSGMCIVGLVDKDSDGDGFVDAACGGDDCADQAGADPACNGLPGASCHPGLIGADTCDGADNDCDNSVDEDHAVSATSCGLGACAGNAGTLICSAGSAVDTCDPVAGAASNDASCNNVNDDCDGATDEDYLVTVTTCGTGACAGNSGTLSCAIGVETDSCDPLAGAAANDATCDNLNDDCDGATDEGYLSVATSCGVGACAGNAGTSSCALGVESSSCDPLAGAAANDPTCDGVDDDCDSFIDEDPTLTWFADADGDTYGLAASTLNACLQPLNFVANSLDCADTPTSDPLCGGLDGSFCNPDIGEGPDGDVTCADGVDNDCDGLIDASDAGCAPAGFVASNVDPADFTPLVAIDLTGCTTPVIFDSTTLTYSGNWCGPQPVPVEVNAGGVDVVVLPMDAFTLPSGIRLELVGKRPIIALVYGDVDISSGIDAGAIGSTPGPGGSSATLCATGLGSQGESGGLRGGGGGGGGFGDVGGIGGIGGTGQGGTFAGGNPGGLEGNAAITPLRGGCDGGGGGIPSTGGSAPAGAGGGALQVSASGTIAISGRIHVGGGGGSSGNPRRVGGGGGGSGGAVLLEAPTISVTGGVFANGGGGGGGNGGNTGSPTSGEDSKPSLVAAAGGVGSETAGNGGDGSVDPSNAGNLGEDDTGAGGGGGGGGGGGRIRLNAGTSCQVGTATWSPQPTSNAAPGCP